MVVAIEATGAMHAATHGIWLMKGGVQEDEAAQKMDFLSQATIDSGGIMKGPQRRDDGAGVDDDDKRWRRSKGFASHKSQRKRRWISFDSRSLQVSSSLARSAKHRGRSESGDRSVGYYRLSVGWETRPEMNPQVYGLRSATVKQSRS